MYACLDNFSFFCMVNFYYYYNYYYFGWLTDAAVLNGAH